MSRALFLALASFLVVASATANTFTVINTNDTGAGSLRQAITDANNQAGLDTIEFTIPGTGVHTITPATQLPSIISPVVIDGYSQPGSSANTLATGENAVLLIEISGATLGNNGNALVLEPGANGSTIKGLVIDHGWSTAIFVDTDSVVIEGCFLGTDPTGLAGQGNTQGVNANFGAATSNLRVGGTTAAARNLISANAVGVLTQSGTNQLIQGNFIGTDKTGNVALANAADVDVRSDNCTVGGTTVSSRNIIAGNGNSGGISLSGGNGDQIQGNFIGTNVTGTQALGFANGIFLSNGATNTLIGGLTATPGTPPGNLISGNQTGVFVSQSQSNNTIQGNLIGTNAAGTAALSNSLDGVVIQGAFNLVGGSTTSARNVISGNGLRGIFLGTNNASVHDNMIQGNFIGTKINGSGFIPNATDGIFVVESFSNTVGGSVTTAGAPPANVIAGNGGNGIGISFGAFGVTGLAIKGNSIFSNGGLGIDLNENGVTLNDVDDADSGTNNLQNFPVLSSVTNSGGITTIAGTLDSIASKTYRIEFFANDAIDATGFGEGQIFLGFTNASTNASGNASFNVSFPQIGAGQRVTSTATDPNGNTSEFSGANGQLLNISTRLGVQTGNNVLIGGFIIGGTGNKQLLLRALGPTLTQFGVGGVLADPTLELRDSAGALIATNDNWKDTQQAAITATGLAPPDDKESAILHTFAPGNNTAIVRGKNNTTGVGLVEAYDLDQAVSPSLTNISTRGFVDTGNNVMIGGFISGNGLVKVVVRALGPTLSQFGVPNVLADPTLELREVNGTVVASNDNWQDTQQADIQASGFAPPNTAESAIIVTRPPGNTTAIVSGKNNTTGNALVEVYILSQ